MIHLFWSLLFLILSIVLALLYLLFIYFICFIAVSTWVFCKNYVSIRILYYAFEETCNWIKEKISVSIKSKYFFAIIIIVATLNISIYAKQRMKWMGGNSGNLLAKEYWVAGQVVNFYRNMYCLFNHPDDWLIQPFTLLQDWIYCKGIRYIQEDDGEIGVWTNMWFVYPYARKLYITTDSHATKPSPRMINLVERTWFSLEKQATGKWSDNQMKEQYYLRGFPVLAFYYTAEQGFLTGRFVGSGKLLSEDAYLLARVRKIVDWLSELQDKWKESPITENFVHNNPKIKALLQLSRIDGAARLIRGSILNHRFSCTNRDVQNYISFRDEFVRSQSVLPQIIDQNEANRLYNIAINTMIGRFVSYTLDRFCGVKVAGKENMKRYTGRSRPPVKHREHVLQGLFEEEIKILEESSCE